MSNRCYTTIVLCGSNAAIAKAEDSLKAIYRDTWDDAVERGNIRVPRGRCPEYTYRVYPPAYVYYLSYPWHPPGAELDKLAAANPDVEVGKQRPRPLYPALVLHPERFPAMGALRAGNT